MPNLELEETNYNYIAEKYTNKKGMRVIAKFLKKELLSIN